MERGKERGMEVERNGSRECWKGEWTPHFKTWLRHCAALSVYIVSTLMHFNGVNVCYICYVGRYVRMIQKVEYMIRMFELWRRQDGQGASSHNNF